MKIKLSNKKFFLLLHSAIVLVISYLIVTCFLFNTNSLSFFSVLDESGDVPMSDMYMYFNSKRGPAKLGTNIILVSIDSCKDRSEIAKVIEQIDSLKPKVIGLDIFFKNRKEPKADAVLENVIRKCESLVIPCELRDEQREDNDKYNTCVSNFFVGQENHNFNEGFVNLDGNGFSTIRTFTPTLFLQKGKSFDTIYCFAAQIVKLYNKTAFQKLLQRKGNLEIINFQPLWVKKIDKNAIEANKEKITNKIVLIGSVSEDMHKTAIFSQMSGMEIHAYIISTIIEDKYIDKLDNFWTKVFNFLLCYLFALFCWVATTKFKKGIAILIKLVQVAILFLAFLAGRFLFNHFNIDIAYTQTIIVMGVLILIVDIYNVFILFGSNLIFKLKK